MFEQWGEGHLAERTLCSGKMCLSTAVHAARRFAASTVDVGGGTVHISTVCHSPPLRPVLTFRQIRRYESRCVLPCEGPAHRRGVDPIGRCPAERVERVVNGGYFAGKNGASDHERHRLSRRRVCGLTRGLG